MKKMVDRNPHTGEALRSKQTSDAYRNNYDLIFRGVPELTPFPDYGDVIELSPESECICGPDDGSGYFATKDGYSDKHPFGRVERPKWATHFIWFNK